MGLSFFEKLQASMSLDRLSPLLPFYIYPTNKPPSITTALSCTPTVPCLPNQHHRARALPPRAKIHPPRQAHHLLQRRPVCRRRIRICQLADIFYQLFVLEVEQGARCPDKGARTLWHHAEVVEPQRAEDEEEIRRGREESGAGSFSRGGMWDVCYSQVRG